jgi:RNA recognition motif-containing protein
MTDLPKKKNIKRDLLLAFKKVSGLLEINPNVLGNEKTRDPICKGSGFLIFDSIENASRCVFILNHKYF